MGVPNAALILSPSAAEKPLKLPKKRVKRLHRSQVAEIHTRLSSSTASVSDDEGNLGFLSYFYELEG